MSLLLITLYWEAIPQWLVSNHSMPNLLQALTLTIWLERLVQLQVQLISTNMLSLAHLQFISLRMEGGKPLLEDPLLEWALGLAMLMAIRLLDK